jgi:spore coat polysaccharide biosynthesis protein SpsF
MKTGIVVQARMTSTRLPGKVMKNILGRPMLSYLMERLKRVQNADDIIIATTTNREDEAIVEFCHSNGITCYRGSEHDVLSRYYEAAEASDLDVIVRITSDCPLIDPAVIEDLISCYIDEKEHLDYLSNTQLRTYPRGMDVEVFSFESLTTAHLEACEASEREHVTVHMYSCPTKYRIASSSLEIDHSEHRWTVDTPEDFEFVSAVFEEIYPENPLFTMEDVLSLVKKNPHLSEINAHIEQKKT